MKKIFFVTAAIAASSVLMLSCSSDDTGNPDETEIDGTKKVVNMLSNPQPVKLTSEQRVFANDNNLFTLNFLKAVSETDTSGKSFIYSPLSITYVLSMVNDAATGQTERELEQTLGFHEGGIQAVNDYCKKLIEGLPKVDEDVTLNIANAIFLNNKYKLKEQFLMDMNAYYDAKAEALDFFSPKTLDHINGWCNDKTNGMIPTILDEVDPMMMSYLLNAIYFKADWTSKFDPKNTKKETFTAEKGKQELPMMHQKALISYLKNDTYSAVEIPYGNGYWNMTVMLPEEGKSTKDIISLLAERGMFTNTYTGGEGETFYPYEVDLKLPRYETSSDTNEMRDGLVGLLYRMGIRLAFNPNNMEICNMCDLPVYIDMMRQKAKIKVNEDGSEAAAVTVAGVETTSAGPREYSKATFHANRPFVYIIREASSGVIVFVGRFNGE